MQNKTKSVTIYPYQCFSKSGVKLEKIEKVFSETFFSKNRDTYSGETKISASIKETENAILFGTLSKLKRDIQIRNLITNEKKDLEQNEEAEQDTHFLWDYDKGLLLCQYNYETFGILGNSIAEYLSKKVGIENDIFLTPFLIEDVIEKIEKSKFATKISLKITNPSEILLDRLGFSKSEIFKKAVEDGYDVSVTLAKKKKKGAIPKFIEDKVINSIRGNESNLETAKITIDSGETLNLLKSTFIHYGDIFEVEKVGNNLSEGDFKAKIKELYLSKKQDLLNAIPDEDKRLRKAAKEQTKLDIS